jgi:hypothetical protein
MKMIALARTLQLSFVLAGSLALSGCSSSSGDPSSSETCTQWNVAGTWSTQQTNSFAVTIVFSQQDETVGGTAEYIQADGSQAQGTISGTLVGDQLNVTIAWSAGFSGHYVATVTSGHLSGSTTPTNGGPTIAWTGTGNSVCAS